MFTYTLPRPTRLERALCDKLSPKQEAAQWTTYPNKEEIVVVPMAKPDKAVVVIARTAPPPSNLWRTLLLIDALKNSGVKEIGIALPYFGYSRHDRPFEPGGSCAAVLFAEILRAAGATSLVTIDIHSEVLPKANILPITNLSMLPMMAEYLKNKAVSATMIVSPDHGGINRAEAFALAYGNNLPVAWCEKVHQPTGGVKVLALHGEVVGDRAIIVDDMLDTGGTIEAAATLLRARGVEHLILCVTHPLFTGTAAARIAKLGFEQIITTNTVPLNKAAKGLANLTVLDATNVLTDYFQ